MLQSANNRTRGILLLSRVDFVQLLLAKSLNEGLWDSSQPIKHHGPSLGLLDIKELHVICHKKALLHDQPYEKECISLRLLAIQKLFIITNTAVVLVFLSKCLLEAVLSFVVHVMFCHLLSYLCTKGVLMFYQISCPIVILLQVNWCILVCVFSSCLIHKSS